MRVYILLIFLSISIFTDAQDTSFAQFREKAEDFSAIYCGKTAVYYHPLQYANHPYWETEEYRNGTLCYQNRIYTDVPLRYDVLLNELNILSPQKIGVNADLRKVNYFILNDVLFIPNGNSFQLILFEGEYIKLTSSVYCNPSNDILQDKHMLKTFATKARYTLNIGGNDYEVKNRKSFKKYFPDYKKQMKKYAKEKMLNFKNQQRESLTAMARYVDSLIKSDRHEK